MKSIAIADEATMIPKETTTIFGILAAISFCHMLNDIVQSLIPAIYPILKDSFQLNFTQIGLITLTFQISASLLQPLVGIITDRRPMPYSLVCGMGFTLAGLLLLSTASSYPVLLGAAALVGVGSAVFHPESSRVARMAAGKRHGLAQSLFQVGGNAGSAIGPLLGALIVLQRGQGSIAYFSVVALLGMIVLYQIGHWYAGNIAAHTHESKQLRAAPRHFSPARVQAVLAMLIVLMFAKFFYTVSLSSYYTFYLMDKFGVSVQSAQFHLFAYLGAVALGTVGGGYVGDIIGRRRVIWWSMIGVIPFALALPYANLFWTGAISVVIGLILASAFPAILVYAQELMPGGVGMVAGLFFGLAFGMAGIGAAALGWLADETSIAFVYQACSYLPLIGAITFFLPDIERAKA
ncbi:MAG: MFS transporter [Candidatus Hydrogenedens sp.]|nr:MFS transporter [Candidatus Hydrogenedens sp.]